MNETELSKFYGAGFYTKENKSSLASARAIVPLIFELLHPESVVDIGCGQGEWLSVFADQGLKIRGIDGGHITDDQLLIPHEHFSRHDLSQPFHLNERFDLAMSLEVGEHLPRASSKGFVSSLTQLAPAVLFSAALPRQGGINHINEQWPWFWKDLFTEAGYVRLDPFRKNLWNHPDVGFYYQQNLYLFVDPAVHGELIQQVGTPDKYSEMTLIKTTILQDITAESLFQRGWKKGLRLLGFNS